MKHAFTNIKHWVLNPYNPCIIVFVCTTFGILLMACILCVNSDAPGIMVKKTQYDGHDYNEFYQAGRCVEVEHSMECKKCYDFFD